MISKSSATHPCDHSHFVHSMPHPNFGMYLTYGTKSEHKPNAIYADCCCVCKMYCTCSYCNYDINTTTHLRVCGGNLICNKNIQTPFPKPVPELVTLWTTLLSTAGSYTYAFSFEWLALVLLLPCGCTFRFVEHKPNYYFIITHKDMFYSCRICRDVTLQVMSFVPCSCITMLLLLCHIHKSI